MHARLVFLIAILALPASASAQHHSAPAVETNDSIGSYRSKSNDWLISPGKTGTVSAQLNFITSEDDLEFITGKEGGLKFTDVVLLRLASRYSIGGVAEIFADAALLPKQPSTMDESPFQNASVGARIGLIEHLATSLRVTGGTTLEAEGAWGAGSLGLDGRVGIDEYVVFDMGLHGIGTGVSQNDESVGLIEVVGSFQIVLKAPKVAAMWIGTEFYFPVAHKDSGAVNIDPQNRVNVQIGGVLSFVESWDIYAKYVYFDRGDSQDPATILPILDGGFDQQQMIVGLTYHFGTPGEGDTWEPEDNKPTAALSP